MEFQWKLNDTAPKLKKMALFDIPVGTYFTSGEDVNPGMKDINLYIKVSGKYFYSFAKRLLHLVTEYGTVEYHVIKPNSTPSFDLEVE
jgi:hypothetical protein